MVSDSNYSYDISKVAKRVKAIRDSHNMSQSQFAEWIGFATDTISKLERGLRGISGEMVAAISIKAGVSSDYILYGKVDSDISLDTRNQIKEHLLTSIKLLDYE